MFHPPGPRRNKVWADVETVVGIPLEVIPANARGEKWGWVLISSEWRDHYFVNNQAGWEISDYYAHAEKRMADIGIIPIGW